MKSHYLLLVDEVSSTDHIIAFLRNLVRKEHLGKVTLARVANFSPAAVVDYPLEYADIMAADAERRDAAEAFLHEIAETIVWGPIEHAVVVLQGDKAEELSRFAANNHFDSILMVSREHSWFTRLLSDNLVDRVRNAVAVPFTLLPSQKFASIKRT